MGMAAENTNGATGVKPGNPSGSLQADTGTGRSTHVLTIYVPSTPNWLFRQGEGTAIVGTGVLKGGRMRCYYQEFLPDTYGMQSYARRLMHAADRLTADAPTHRMVGLEPDELVSVGTYDGRRGVVLTIDNPDVLAEWSGESAESVIGLRLKPGIVSREELSLLCLEPRTYYFAPISWFRSQAGQVAWYDPATRNARVWDHDDPEVPGLLYRAGFAEHIISRVTGTAGVPEGGR
jgi:hypothetical protein